MTISSGMLLLILGCLLVTFIPRVLPFIFVRKIQMPSIVLKWLSFIPICILTALVVEGIVTDTDQFISFDWQVVAVLIPTILVALFTKSLSLTVLIGVILMAGVRFLSAT
ncbi:AzlD domain-containing protein [Bacillus sp. JCM 19041]|uniref:AzlD domain-containing protein n=1 Tax=Bacillus sp. JCM 19041 TaxID=1460637 RepID=UPI0006CFD988